MGYWVARPGVPPGQIYGTLILASSDDETPLPRQLWGVSSFLRRAVARAKRTVGRTDRSVASPSARGDYAVMGSSTCAW
jgi:hypothetical protein